MALLNILITLFNFLCSCIKSLAGSLFVVQVILSHAHQRSQMSESLQMVEKGIWKDAEGALPFTLPRCI